MVNGWTLERRAQQSEKIHQWQPWTKSTGARTPEGKARSSQNAALGKLNKLKAIEQTMQELKAVQTKLRKLTAKRHEWWNK